MIQTKSGTTITESMNFQFTGNQPEVGVWEVEATPAGSRTDGISLAAISDAAPSDEGLFILRAGYPQYLRVAASVTKGDNLTAAGDGTFAVASMGDVVCAKALADDISSVIVLAVLFPPSA